MNGDRYDTNHHHYGHRSHNERCDQTQRYVDANGGIQPRRDRMLQRRVLSLDDYKRETSAGVKLTAQQCVAKYGSPVIPIPVALLPGESEEQYEQLFLRFLTTRRQTLESLRQNANPNRERTLRFLFANTRLKWSSSNAPRLPTTPSAVVVAVSVYDLPRSALYVKKCVALSEFQQQIREGLLHRLSKMTLEELQTTFGVPVTPIFVPLAVGETEQQYEDRFVAWLWETKRLALEELETHPNRSEERYYRMQFARWNARGDVRFGGPPRNPAPNRNKRERERETESGDRGNSVTSVDNKRKRTDVARTVPMRSSDYKDEQDHTSGKSMGIQKETTSTCVGQATIQACTACSCRQCLVRGMRLLAEKITHLENKRAKKKQQHIAQVIDLTEEDQQAPASAVRSEDDAVETRLEEEYDAINDQIVMNEKVLETSAARLASTPVEDISETTRLQDEDQEMRELIRGEMHSRNVALAVLIVYMWRHEIPELRKMVEDSSVATHVGHVQRGLHHKCAQLASDLTDKRQCIARVKTQLETTTAREREATMVTLSALLAQLESEVHDLRTQRRHAFKMLIYFDERVRRLIHGLLLKIIK